MVGQRSLSWPWVSWGWVLLPILGVLPGSVPLRLSTQWLAVLGSLVVIGYGIARPARQAPTARPLGWLGLACLVLAVLQARHVEASFLWACQVLLALTATATLVQQQAFRWCRQAVIASAWAQVVVALLQRLGVPTLWPHNAHGSWWGTVGSPASAAILIACGALWATGWQGWALTVATVLTGSGTAIPIVLVARVWPWLWQLGIVGLMTLGSCAVLGIGWLWRTAWLARWEVWQAWRPTWWGLGFTTFPGGFADATTLGQALGWRDYHNVWMDWLTRFGVPGALVMAGLTVWMWQARARGHRWMLVFAGWVACWQSLEQFPVLIVPLLVWWMSLLQGGDRAVPALS